VYICPYASEKFLIDDDDGQRQQTSKLRYERTRTGSEEESKRTRARLVDFGLDICTAKAVIRVSVRREARA